jgi:hypothetical protein
VLSTLYSLPTTLYILLALHFNEKHSKNMKAITTLGQFIIERQSDFPYAKGELSRLLRDIGIAAKIVNREVNKAGLADILGEFGTINVQGEDVKKLDVFANEQFITALSAGGETCAVASEENEGLVHIDSHVSKNAKYVVCVDPLDGSSNIDVNVAIGTIFSIYRRSSFSGKVEEKDYLQRGTVRRPCLFTQPEKELTDLPLILASVNSAFLTPIWFARKMVSSIRSMKEIMFIFRMELNSLLNIARWKKEKQEGRILHDTLDHLSPIFTETF